AGRPGLRRGRDRDAGGAWRLPEGAGDPLAYARQRLATSDRSKAPDQVILAASGALRGSRPGVLAVADRDLAAFPLAPGGAAGPRELVARSAVDREARRSMARAEPEFVGRVGANEAVGSIGDGDRDAGLLDCRDGYRPVGRRPFGDGRGSRATATRGEGDRAEHGEP